MPRAGGGERGSVTMVPHFGQGTYWPASGTCTRAPQRHLTSAPMMLPPLGRTFLPDGTRGATRIQWAAAPAARGIARPFYPAVPDRIPPMHKATAERSRNH